MTNEEAWNRIDAIIAKHEIDDEYVTITSLLDYDALRLARKLLEQEHCEDAISRQAAIDLADELKDDLPDDDRLSDMVMSHNEGILEYQTQLSLLPFVQPECTEDYCPAAFMPVECEDCVSREAVLEQTYNWSKDEFLRVTNPFDYLRKRINSLPYVNPVEKMGHWEWVQYDSNPNIGNWHCSECRTIIPHMPEEIDNTPIYKWCPMCGTKMASPTGVGDDALCNNCPCKTDTCQEGLHCPMDE